MVVVGAAVGVVVAGVVVVGATVVVVGAAVVVVGATVVVYGGNGGAGVNAGPPLIWHVFGLDVVLMYGS